MSLSYATWPFRPIYERTPDETERWWEQCYLPADGEATLLNEPRWCVVSGGPGSGRSVALAALEKHEAGSALVIHYPPEYWPGGIRALISGGNHLAQIMAQASLAIRALLTDQPEKVANLTLGQREFLRWLLERVGGPRAFTQWVDGLDPAMAEMFQVVASADLYPSTTQSADIIGQIEGLTALTRKLGYRRVLIMADLSLEDALANIARLGDLFSGLDLMHRPGFAVVAAMPDETLTAAEIIRRTRARIVVAPLIWRADSVRDIALRHWRAALGDQALSAQDIVAPELWQALEQILLDEFKAYTPAAWVNMAETVLYYASETTTAQPIPLQPMCKAEVGRLFFARHVPLRLDLQQHGVWRGSKFIHLTEQPLNFLRVLSASNGQPIGSYSEALRAVVRPQRAVGKSNAQGNIHTVVARLREAIEPFFPGPPVYLRRNDEGYYLENTTR